MTWIKPSILWMAYRSGWATKPGQERVLAIEITRTGFEWALAHSCLSHDETGTYPDHSTWQTSKEASPVRVQWDPERDLHQHGLTHRAIQIGLSGPAVDKYIDDWILSLTDITSTMRQIHHYVENGQLEAAHQLLPSERPYPLSTEVAATIGAS